MHSATMMSIYKSIGMTNFSGFGEMIEEPFCREVLECVYDRYFGRKVDALGLATWMPCIYLKNQEGVKFVENHLKASDEYISKLN